MRICTSQVSSLFINTIVHSVQEHTVFTSPVYDIVITSSHINLMEPPSRTTPYLDILLTPPVYETYIFL